ncbi:MAG: PIN domain-containing protein [Bacteroidetes bacterium]|nr:PIN domain-containing protein [Bacteroidota bacterium]
MTRVIVDTNIAFSAILNSTGRIGKVLFNSRGIFHFVSCKHLRIEIENHLPKLQILTGLDQSVLMEIVNSIISRIELINEEFISKENLLIAECIVKDIDLNDVLFVALSLELKGKLWTGDKKLVRGITDKGFDQIVTTIELSEIIDEIGKQNPGGPPDTGGL